jgi:hypothetical protein
VTLRQKLNLVTLLSLLALSAVVGVYFYNHYRQERIVKEQLTQVTDGAASQIREQLLRVERIAQGLADRLSVGTLSEDALIAELRHAVASEPFIVEAGVAYARDKGPNGSGLYGPHFGNRGGKNEFFRVDASYDYTQAEWYKDVLAHGSGWTEPYYGKALKSWVIGYGIPVRAPAASATDAPIAVVRVNYAMKEIRRKIGALPLGSEGYASLVQLKSTRIIYHPNESYVKDRLTLFDLAKKRRDAVLLRMANDIARGRAGICERPATLTGELAWNIYRPIVGTTWNIVLVFVKDEALGDAKNDREGGIVIAVALVIALSLIATRILRIENGVPRRLWTAAVLVTGILGCAVGYIWYLSFDPRVFNGVLRGMVYDAQGLQRFRSEQEEFSRQRGAIDPIFIPTGVAISAIEFKNATDVTMKGYVWQKNPTIVRDQVTPGFELADAIESQTTEAYRHVEGDYEVRGYSFRATLRQQFDFRQYPLDFQRVRLTLSRKDFEHNVIFVPDLNAFPSMIPQSRPGLERTFGIAGWQVEKTFFNYATADYNTDFGIEQFVGKDRYPVLAYNVVIRRDFRSPFIANIVPLLLIAGIGFALLAMIHREPDRIAAYDARGGRVTGTSAALFFAVLLAHIRLRNELVGLRETIYIEYFYFVMYAACLVIVTDALMVASRNPPSWLSYRDNFVPKLIYWPVLFGLVLAITIGFFV